MKRGGSLFDAVHPKAGSLFHAVFHITVHRAVQHHGRGHAAQPQRAGERGGLPMAVRNGCTTTLATFGTPAHTRHFCGSTGLIDEDQTLRIKVRLAVEPSPAPCGDVWPRLLAGVRCFF